MSVSKKREKHVMEETESNESAMMQLGEIVSESLLEKDLNQADAFEYYAHKLRTHLHADPIIFKQRFSAGYRVLIEELLKEPIL